jgi:hypothetical protein
MTGEPFWPWDEGYDEIPDDDEGEQGMKITRTTTIDYDDAGNVIREVQVTEESPGVANVDYPRLAVDAEGFVWWVHSNGYMSMARTNPDNSDTPLPLTYYAATP